MLLSTQRAKEKKIRNIYLIKDLAIETGYSIHTLKYYLNLGLIQEFGRSPETGYRYFDDATVERLRKIRFLRKEGKSIKAILHELL
jgi:DNA-binding transcriptional MerR regulator